MWCALLSYFIIPQFLYAAFGAYYYVVDIITTVKPCNFTTYYRYQSAISVSPSIHEIKVVQGDWYSLSAINISLTEMYHLVQPNQPY